MIRSNTKGIYKEDNDSLSIENNEAIRNIVDEIRERIKTKTHGFARLYPTVVMEYFGGMKKHFQNIKDILEPNALCAYIVGDQSSYLQVNIPTAEILSSIVSELGYEVLEIIPWRTSWATVTSKKIGMVHFFRQIG